MSAALNAIDDCLRVLYGRAPYRTPQEVRAFEHVEELRAQARDGRNRKERSDASRALKIAQRHLAELRAASRCPGASRGDMGTSVSGGAHAR